LLITTTSGLTASMNACELDVALPWCGDFRTTMGNRSSVGMSASSTSLPMSPVSSIDTCP